MTTTTELNFDQLQRQIATREGEAALLQAQLREKNEQLRQLSIADGQIRGSLWEKIHRREALVRNLTHSETELGALREMDAQFHATLDLRYNGDVSMFASKDYGALVQYFNGRQHVLIAERLISEIEKRRVKWREELAIVEKSIRDQAEAQSLQSMLPADMQPVDPAVIEARRAEIDKQRAATQLADATLQRAAQARAK